MNALRRKELIVFDMDGTLTPSKAPMHKDMARLLLRLLEGKRVAVIGGGKYRLFKIQLISALKRYPEELLKKLFLFPTTATSFYRYQNGWKNVYALNLPMRNRRKIKKAFRDVLREVGYVHPKKVYGKVIEDRRTQITFSALGQDIVAMLGKEGTRRKEEWKRKYTPLKMKIAKRLAKQLPGFTVLAAGFTSIDVVRKGVDKAYGLRQIEKYLHVPIKKMLFVGDALFPGGNDHAAKRTGVQCIAVTGPTDTKKIIRKILKET